MDDILRKTFMNLLKKRIINYSVFESIFCIIIKSTFVLLNVV